MRYNDIVGVVLVVLIVLYGVFHLGRFVEYRIEQSERVDTVILPY